MLMISRADNPHDGARGQALSEKGIDQLLVDLNQIRALVAECLVSPEACHVETIYQHIRDVSLPLCQLSLARVVEVLNSHAPYADGLRVTAPSSPLKAYLEVFDDVICYIENIRDGFERDDTFLETIEEKMYNAKIFTGHHAQLRLEHCPPEVIHDFLMSVSGSLRDIRTVLVQWQLAPQDKKIAMNFLHHLHTLKGSVLVYDVDGLLESIQHLESYVAAFLKGELAGCEELFELLERYLNRLSVVTGLLNEQHMSVLSLSLEGDNPREKAFFRRNALVSRSNIEHQPFAQKLPRLHFLVERATVMLGKSAHLLVRGDMLELPDEVLSHLIAPLELLLWNAIDHGIEPPAIRKAAGKPESGEILLVIEMNAEGSGVMLTISDDGAGIDESAVREKALDLGCVTAAEIDSASPAEMIFYPGLSTNSLVSSISGRGIGLDVVRAEVTRLGGEVTASSVRGGGTRFTLKVPL